MNKYKKMHNFEDKKVRAQYLTAATAYIQELSLKNIALRNVPAKNIHAQFNGFIDNPFTEVLLIHKGKDLAGFVVIGTDLNCHPNADYYIMEYYIVPKYRKSKKDGRNGYLFASFIKDHIKTHPGKYCMYLYEGDDKLRDYWMKIFEESGYSMRKENDEYAMPMLDQYFAENKDGKIQMLK